MNIDTEILKELFGDNEKFTGYGNIVESLISKGRSLSTTTALDIDFNMAQPFISVESLSDGVGLVEISFDKEKAMSSGEFKSINERMLLKVNTDIINAMNILETLQDKRSELLKFLK